MKSLSTTALFLLATAVISGCTHTVVGGGGRPSPDRKYMLVIEGHGAPGKAYVDTSKKLVYLSIFDRSIPGFERAFTKEYTFEAGRLTWKEKWLSSKEVRVEFFDYRYKVKDEEPIEPPHLIESFVIDVQQLPYEALKARPLRAAVNIKDCQTGTIRRGVGVWDATCQLESPLDSP